MLSGDLLAWSTKGDGLALGRLIREKPLDGYMYAGLGKRETVRPAVREMNLCACSRQENHLLSRCEGKDYATISFLKFANEDVVRFADSSDEVSINMQPSSTPTLREPSSGLYCFRRCRSGVQPHPRIMIDGDRSQSRFAMRGCTVSRLIFLIRTFLLCDSQLFHSAPNSIRKLRCETG